jgi:N-acetylmuramoyl-L-alanine amidase
MFPNAIIQGHKDFPNVAKACPSFDAKAEYKNI